MRNAFGQTLWKAVGPVRLACGAALVLLLALRIWDPSPVEELRLRSFDFYQLAYPRESTQQPVTIVDIDEKSLEQLGQWPWPRTLLATLVQRMSEAGAVAIGFDVVFAERDRTSAATIAETYRNLDEDTKLKLRSLPSNDLTFADALKRSRVVVGQAGHAKPAAPDADIVPPAGTVIRGPSPLPFLVSFPGLLRNFPELEAAAAGRGVFSLRPERDGIIRRAPLMVVADGDIVPSMPLDLLRIVTQSPAFLIRTDEAGLRSIAVRGLEIPTDANGQLWVRFARHDRARYVSALDVLQGTGWQDRVAGKLVLIGTSATGLLDVKTTPVDAVVPGVEINAQILENLLSGQLLTRPNYAIGAELTAIALIGLLVIVVTPMLGPAGAAIFVGLIAAAMAGASWYAFLHHQTLIDFTFPAVSTVLICAALFYANYAREQRQRQQIRFAFSRYLSPALVEQLAHSPQKLVLGGEERRMTVLFSDMRGFTAISESFKSEPQKLTSLMNRYFTPMTKAIIDHRGTVDKYIGDAIMAFWNAPLDDESHEANACAAALEMISQLQRLNEALSAEAEHAAATYLPLEIGIGINTGACVVGNLGSDFRFDYSVLGDSVNLASRLESRGRDYGAAIVLGAATADAVQDRFATLEVDLLRVKGKRQPESVHILLGGRDLMHRADFVDVRQHHALMLAAYRRRDWHAAVNSLEVCRGYAARLGIEAIYETYATRMSQFGRQPPPQDWDGVYVHHTK